MKGDRVFCLECNGKQNVPRPPYSMKREVRNGSILIVLGECSTGSDLKLKT
jgi:hypothetical protein